MALETLPLNNMSDRHHGLTQPIADSFKEAACVCLDRHHDPPQEFTLRVGSSETEALVEWSPPSARCKLAWANDTDTTEQGAYGCALAATELALGMFAICRAETLTGADYYVGPVDRPLEDLEGCYRLEVSGTKLEEQELRRMLNRKIRQAKAGRSSLPAIVTVVGFSVRLIAMRFVEEES
jgi:hypothetical protein